MRTLGTSFLAVAFASLVGALASGCYDPTLASPGFHCHATDNPACPTGQACVSGICVSNGTSVTIPTDAAAKGPVVDLASAAAADLASMPVDLAMSLPDLATPPPDLATPACVANGGDCTYHDDSVCCSQYCKYSTNKCETSP